MVRKLLLASFLAVFFLDGIRSADPPSATMRAVQTCAADPLCTAIARPGPPLPESLPDDLIGDAFLASDWLESRFHADPGAAVRVAGIRAHVLSSARPGIGRRGAPDGVAAREFRTLQGAAAARADIILEGDAKGGGERTVAEEWRQQVCSPGHR